jgi:hypothetical protein
MREVAMDMMIVTLARMQTSLNRNLARKLMMSVSSYPAMHKCCVCTYLITPVYRVDPFSCKHSDISHGDALGLG